MEKRIPVEIGPDRLELANAAASFGDKSLIRLAVRLPEGQRTYHFYVQSMSKPVLYNPNKGFEMAGRAAYWNQVPMGHGESSEGPLQAATLSYDPQTRKGELVLT